MSQESIVRPPHSVILIMDLEIGDPPTEFEFGNVGTTETCVAVGTRAEDDGETRVRLLDDTDHPPTLASPLSEAWSRDLRTAGTLVVCDVLGSTLLSMHVEPVVHLEIFTNDSPEPDETCTRILPSPPNQIETA